MHQLAAKGSGVAWMYSSSGWIAATPRPSASSFGARDRAGRSPSYCSIALEGQSGRDGPSGSDALVAPSHHPAMPTSNSNASTEAAATHLDRRRRPLGDLLSASRDTAWDAETAATGATNR